MANVKLAVIDNNTVENVIVGAEESISELSIALNKEILYMPELDLQIGDLRVGGKWTRNVEGIQTELTEKPTYDELVAALNEIYAAMEEMSSTEETTPVEDASMEEETEEVTNND